jgi:hypothetical protein
MRLLGKVAVITAPRAASAIARDGRLLRRSAASCAVEHDHLTRRDGARDAADKLMPATRMTMERRAFHDPPSGGMSARPTETYER